MAGTNWWENDPVVEQPQAQPQADDWYKNDPVVSQNQTQPQGLSPLGNNDFSGYEGGPEVSQADLDAVKPKTPEEMEAQDDQQFDGSYDPSQDQSLIPGSQEYSQREQGLELAKQYKNFQSGPQAQGQLGDFKPSTDMYANDPDPWNTYKRLSSKADSHTLLGAPVINNTVVPAPGQYDWFSNTGNKIADNAADATRETAKNLLVTGASMIDQSFGTKWAETLDQNIANPPEHNRASDALLKDGIKLTAASIAGAKLGAKAGEKMTGNVNGIIAQTLAGLGTIIGGVSVQNPDDSTLVTGKNALAPILTGVPKNDDGSFSSQYLQKKLDQLQDAFITVYPAARVADAGAIGINFIKKTIINPITKALPGSVGKNARETAIATDILHNLGAGDKEGVDRVINYIKANKEEVFKFAEDGIDDAKIARTTMSAVAEGADKAGDENLVNAAIQTEKQASKMPAYLTKKEQPIQQLKATQEQATESRGGLQSIDQTRKLLSDEATNKVNEANTLVSNAENENQLVQDTVRNQSRQTLQDVRQQTDANLSRAQKKVSDDILKVTQDSENKVKGAEAEVESLGTELKKMYDTDKTFGQTIDQLSKDSGIDIANKFRINETKKILPEIVNGIKTLDDKKDALYNALPEGVPVDEHSFNSSLIDAHKLGILPSDVQRTLGEFADEKGVISNIDFKTMYNDVLPKIKGEIAKTWQLARTTGKLDETKLKALDKIADNILVKQMDYISSQPGVGEEAKKAAISARDYYRDVVSPFRNQRGTPISELWMVKDDSWHDHQAVLDKEGNIIDIGRNYSAGIEAQNVVENGIKDSKLYSSKQVIDFMNSPDYKGDRQGLVKVWKGEVAGAIADQIQANGGDLSKVDMNLVYKTLKDKGVSIKEAFPEETKQIESFANNIIGGKLKLEKAKSALQLAQDDAKEAIKNVKSEGKDYLKSVEKSNQTLKSDTKNKVREDLKFAKDYGQKLTSDAANKAKIKQEEVYNSVLSDFIEKDPNVPNGVRPLKNGFAIFKGLLSKDNNEGKLQDILQKVKDSGNPEAQRGVEAAYFAYLQEGLQRVANPKNINVTEAKRFLSDNTSRQKYGEMIFSNRSDPKEAELGKETLDTYSKLIDGVLKEREKSHGSPLSFQDNVGNTEKEATSAFGYLTRYLFGVLNPTSTKISSTGKRVISMSNADAHAKEVREALFSDPDYAIKLFEKIRDDLKGGMSPELKKALVSASLMNAKQETLSKTKETLGYDKKVPEGVNP